MNFKQHEDQTRHALRRYVAAIWAAVPASMSDAEAADMIVDAIHKQKTIKVIDTHTVDCVGDDPDDEDTRHEVPPPPLGSHWFRRAPADDGLYPAIASVARAALENGCRESPAALIVQLRKAFIGCSSPYDCKAC